jgi:hypothetical protein
MFKKSLIALAVLIGLIGAGGTAKMLLSNKTDS